MVLAHHVRRPSIKVHRKSKRGADEPTSGRLMVAALRPAHETDLEPPAQPASDDSAQARGRIARVASGDDSSDFEVSDDDDPKSVHGLGSIVAEEGSPTSAFSRIVHMAGEKGAKGRRLPYKVGADTASLVDGLFCSIESG